MPITALWKDMLDTALMTKGLFEYTNRTIPLPADNTQIGQWHKKHAEAKLQYI